MITWLLLELLTALVAGIGNAMPDMDTPPFFGQIAGLVSTLSGYMAPLGTWVPFSAAVAATAVVIAAVGVALAVKLVRIVASFVTGGGGGAA